MKQTKTIPKKREIKSFGEFFLHASEKEKMKVFTEAARRANKDQRALIKKIKQT